MIVEVEHVKNWEQVLLISTTRTEQEEIAAEAVISRELVCVFLSFFPSFSCFVFTGNTKSFVNREGIWREAVRRKGKV